MDLVAFAQVVLRRWPVLLLMALLGLSIGYFASTRSPKQYQSTVNLQLNPAARSAFLNYVAEATPVTALAASYREVLRSRGFGDVVVQRLQLRVDPQVVANAMTVQLVPNTNILRIAVTWDHPDDAQQLAQSIAELFISENLRRQMDQAGTLQRVEALEESARAIAARLGPLKQQRDRLDQAVARGDLTRLGELNELETRLTALETSHASLLIEINRTKSGLDTASILDRASPPVAVDPFPLAQAQALGLVLGVLAGAAAASLLERLDNTVRSPEDIVQLSGSAPLAAVGRVRGQPAKGGSTGTGPSTRLVTVLEPHSRVAEAFRTLRTNLSFTAVDRPVNTLVVTSARPSEGKSFVASNLAIALAQAGRRVLLVDADLRRPSVHTLFGLSNKRGFMHAFSNGEPWRQAMRGEDEQAPGEKSLAVDGVVASLVPNLWILPAGPIPPNPSEVLGSDAAGRLIRRFSEMWDVVILDTAPLGPVADALLLAKHADGVIAVARANQTIKPALEGCLGALRQTGRPILGVVLNDSRPGRLSRYTAGAYYYGDYESYHSPPSGLPNEVAHTNGVADGAPQKTLEARL